MRVSETFRSLQGEGPSAGAPATFVRFQGCDVGCAWCDTRYTWDPRLGREVALADLLTELDSLAPRDLLVITGGEPLAVDGFPDLAAAACDRWTRVEVETSGIHPPPLDRLNLFWNWSPKLPSATPHWQDTWAYAAAWAGDPRAIAKIVVGKLDEPDLLRLARRLPKEKVWLMGEGMTPAALRANSELAAAICLREGWRLSPRLHVWLWGARRGV